MYTCTHFPAQDNRNTSNSLIHSLVSQEHSFHLSVTNKWYLGIWPTHHFTQVQVSQLQTRFPCWLEDSDFLLELIQVLKILVLVPKKGESSRLEALVPHSWQ